MKSNWLHPSKYLETRFRDVENVTSRIQFKNVINHKYSNEETLVSSHSLSLFPLPSLYAFAPRPISPVELENGDSYLTGKCY